jgi:radical SAM superfamily enzyme YgiQ (UPF0313 family)
LKRNIYFIQANPVYNENDKSVYIPYATGCIAAYAWANKYIQNTYLLGRFIYTREDIEASVATLQSPFLVAFSCSVWNMEYNKAFADKLKKVYPECIVLFGGHHVSPDSSTLSDCKVADILVHGAGEEAFRDILLALADKRSLDGISNISFRKPDGTVIKTKKEARQNVDYPSPYLDGYFDEILKDKIKFSAIIETNRGCPNSCAFCDWGDLKTKVRLFPMEKIEKELHWIAENKIEYIYCGDANFGLFDRDEKITDIIIDLKKTKGYPKKFRVCFTKNRSEFVQKISKKLGDNNIDKSQTLSFQSLSQTVLENIGRKNLDLDHFKHLMSLYNQAGISAVSELILGLPGETYESFCEGICTLLECGQHNSITVYPCELLPNSVMGSPGYIEKHGLRSVKTPYYQIHCDIAQYRNDIPEYSEIVVATKSLSIEDWVRTVIFACYIQALHNLGITRAVSVFLRFEKDISYLEFYSDLLNFFLNAKGTIVNRVLNDISKLANGVAQSKNAWVCELNEFGNITYGFEEIIFLELVTNLDEFSNELRRFLKKYMVEENLLENLLYYQKYIIKTLNRKEIILDLKYDFYHYFNSIYTGNYSPLKKVKNQLIIRDKKTFFNWPDYAREVVWYGRREEATLYTGSKYEVLVQF